MEDQHNPADERTSEVLRLASPSPQEVELTWLLDRYFPIVLEQLKTSLQSVLQFIIKSRSETNEYDAPLLTNALPALQDNGILSTIEIALITRCIV